MAIKIRIGSKFASDPPHAVEVRNLGHAEKVGAARTLFGEVLA
jgi:hypothetical protein